MEGRKTKKNANYLCDVSDTCTEGNIFFSLKGEKELKMQLRTGIFISKCSKCVALDLKEWQHNGIVSCLFCREIFAET